MFSSNIRYLPSFYSYAAAMAYYDRTAKPRGSMWADNERPLDDGRKYHYRLDRGEGRISAILHRTDIVTWKEDGHILLDLRYDSTMTREFARRYIPFTIETYSNSGRVFQCLNYDGTLYDCKNTFTFINESNENTTDSKWRLLGDYDKPLKRRLIKATQKELAPILAPFSKWARGMWAVCGGGVSHPFLGETYSPAASHLELQALLEYAHNKDVDEDTRLNTYAKVATAVMTPYRGTYDMIAVTEMLRKVREPVYTTAGAYEWVPYDTPNH